MAQSLHPTDQAESNAMRDRAAFWGALAGVLTRGRKRRPASPRAADLARAGAPDLLQVREAHHRITNSLQIVAGVLLLGARAATSPEVAAALMTAHGRVMATSALERQLAESVGDAVDLQGYLAQLCHCLMDALAPDPPRVVLSLNVPSMMIAPDAAGSLGMVVAELVINALKHAFPGGRSGRITVSFAETAGAWTLKVSDNGVGSPSRAAPPGLGTAIIDALGRQLDAEVITAADSAGTQVRLSGRSTTALDPEPRGPRPAAAL